MGKHIVQIKENGSVCESAVGNLEWVIISGQGKLNTLNDKYQYTATVVMSPEEAQPLIDEINEFFETHKVKKFAKKDAQSLGFRPHKVKTDELDEDDQPIYEEDGNIAFTFKTDTEFKDGNKKKIKVFNAKGGEVDLGSRAIGNGSRGRLKGVVRYYETPKEHGVSLYLNAVQLSKFVPYVGGVQMDEMVDEDGDGFEGFDDGSAPIPDSNQEQAAAAEEKASPKKKGGKGGQPRL
jgi:hypothetical protein